MDTSAILPAGAAVAFFLFLVWKTRPRIFRKRLPLDPRITEARGRAARTEGRARAAALCEAGELSLECRRPTAAFGYFLRATRTDPTSVDALRGVVRSLGPRRQTLERVLFRHLTAVEWSGPGEASARYAIETLVSLYRRGPQSWRGGLFEKLLLQFPTPKVAEPPRQMSRTEAT